jgi:hypothetical protein
VRVVWWVGGWVDSDKMRCVIMISILNLVSNYCCNEDPEFGFPINVIGLILIKYVNCYP